MAVAQKRIPTTQFAQAMLETSSDFAERVRNFELRFGSAGEDVLAVLSQAFYFCWFETDYEDDLIATCRAINTGRPVGFHLCGQVSPGQWVEANTFVVAVQRWMGYDLPLPREMNWDRIRRIRQWLGMPHPAKDWLAALFLCQLVDHLVLRTSFSKLTTEETDEGQYTDYSAWYLRPDGPRYSMGGDPESPEESLPDSYVALCKARIRDELTSVAEDAEALIDNIVRPSQPPCMHRFSRYQEIKVTSIGALKWRGQMPPDDGSKASWRGFWEGYEGAEACLRKWLDDIPPDGARDSRLFGALGPATDRSRAIVREFLLQRPDSGMFSWLKQYSTDHGLTPQALLSDDLPDPLRVI